MNAASQDQGLDDLASSLQRVKGTALAIGRELDSQARLLDGLATAVDTSTAGLESATRRTSVLSRKAGLPDKLCIALGVLVLLLLVLAAALAFL